ncbi:putative membrane protein (plasmid) [Yersinia frederiksenii Y225]|nr:putative membrane protein [Yersinia frederiksenii Y225]
MPIFEYLFKILVVMTAGAAVWFGYEIITADRNCQGFNCMQVPVLTGWMLITAGVCLFVLFWRFTRQ